MPDIELAEELLQIEEADAQLPAILELRPDVLMIAGDHSTPAVVAGHSWHPVPFLLHPARLNQTDASEAFNERACASGSLGILPAQHLMPLVMANALRLTKFGA